MLLKRIIIVAIVSALSLSLIGCGGRSPRVNLSSAYEQKMGDARTEAIVAALESEDKETLKAMFSQQALDEIAEANVDLDKQIDEVIAYYQGEMESYEGLNASSASLAYREQEHQILGMYTVITSKETYRFSFEDCLVNDVSPEEIGLYSFEIITENDKDKIEGFKWRNYEAGIRVRAEG